MVKRRISRRGFVLVMTVVFGATVAIVVASCVGHVAQGARFTRVYIAKDRCRFAAQSAIEVAKARIQARFTAYVGAAGTTVKVDPKSAESYDWFDEVSSDRRTIGKADSKGRTTALTLPDFADGVNGCSVDVRIGRKVIHESSSSIAIVPVVATATYVYPDGLRVSATIQESVCFATGQSAVFDYAYFVNNYGWMSGGSDYSIYINGDLRANGDVSLVCCYVNGFVYAAINDEVGADGNVSLGKQTTSGGGWWGGGQTTVTGLPKMESESAYRSTQKSQSNTRSRPDMSDYQTAGAYDAPATGGDITKSKTSASGKAIVNEQSDPIPMPFVSDLDNYVQYAEECGGTLYCPQYSYTDSLGTSHTVAAKNVNAHYSGTGPSGDGQLADKGALVLVGTSANPIRLNGPVVVDSDVIIKGYVTGQGTIYSGRNVYIIGNIRYKDPPAWNHTDSDDAERASQNSRKDLLGLVAKGNIVVGDASNADWYRDMQSYIGKSSSYVNSYACDPSDASIGYPSVFGDDYTAVETVSGLADEYVAVASTCGGYDSSSGKFGKVRTKTETTLVTATQTEWVPVSYDYYKKYKGAYEFGRDGRGNYYIYHYAGSSYPSVEEVLATTYDRKYYETVCDDAVLSNLAESTIDTIDAVMYNNHGAFGKPAGSGSININGSLVCRDEALSFSGKRLNFNWDMRLKRGTASSAAAALGLPVGPQDPFTVAWQEVPDALNPAYDAEEDGE